MKYAIVKVSDRRFAVGKVQESSMSLQHFSSGKIGKKDQQVSCYRVDLITKPLTLDQAQLFYCYKASGTPITDELLPMLRDESQAPLSEARQ